MTTRPTDQLDQFTLTRAHAPLPTPWIGLHAGYPRFEWPAAAPTEPPTLGALAQALGWPAAAPVTHGTRTLRTCGVVVPSRWERAYGAWLAEHAALDQAEAADDAGAPGPHYAGLVQQLGSTAARAWAGPADLPARVRVRRTVRLDDEAFAAARAIRRWLLDPSRASQRAGDGGVGEALERVTVLVPSGGGFLSRWVREFGRAGVPVNAAVPRPLLELPRVRWVLGLAQLADWGEHPRPRALLLDVLDSSFIAWRSVRKQLDAADPTVNVRRLLSDGLRLVRRNELTADELVSHLRALARDAARPRGDDAGPHTSATGAAAPAEAGAAAVASRARHETRAAGYELAAEFVARFTRTPQQSPRAWLHERLFGDGAAFSLQFSRAARFRSGGDAGAAAHTALQIDAVETLRNVLAADDAGESGDPGDGAPPLREWLHAQLAPRAAVEHRRCAHAVRIVSYEHYAGWASERLICAGLGEGQYPQVPAPPRADEWAWAPALGVDPSAPATAWVREETQRQLDVIALAASRCAGEVELSFAQESAGTGRVYPGPALALICGAWDEHEWRSTSAPGVEDVADGEELAAVAGEGMADGAGPWTVAELEPLALHITGLDSAAVESDELKRLAQAPADLAASQLAAAARWPGGEQGEFGPYTGKLPAPTGDAGPWSATQLGRFGECPSKEFFARTLRARAEEQADVLPSSSEAGNLLHRTLEGLFLAAQADASHPWAWTPSAVAQEQDPLAVMMRATDERLDQEFETWVEQAPSGRRPILQALAERWKASLHNYVERKLKAMVHEHEDLQEAARKQAEYEAKLAAQQESARRFVDAAYELCRGSKKKPAKSKWAEIEGLPTKKASEAAGEAVWRAFQKGDDDREALVADVLRDAKGPKAPPPYSPPPAWRQVFAELPFGTQDKPFELDVAGATLPLIGAIDRVDVADGPAPVLAVRDYKSGKRLNDQQLKAATLAGYHLQLPLYGAVAQQLAANPDYPGLQGGLATTGSLEFTHVGAPGNRKRVDPSRTSLALSEPALADVGPPGASGPTWLEVGVGHALSHARRMSAGAYELAPQLCPLRDARAYCDYSGLCGFRPDASFATPAGVYRPEAALEALVDPSSPAGAATEGQETVGEAEPSAGATAKAKRPKENAAPTACYAPLQAQAQALGDLRAAHSDAQARVLDLEAEWVVAAGAGTGKTYNLVRRYLKAVSQNVSPQAIVCITFTRRAAAEMIHRVRAALLRPDSVADLAEDIQRMRDTRPNEYRDLLFGLSAAPISTIDGLCLRIVQEADRLQDRPPTAAAVSPHAALHARARAWVEGRLERALAGHPDHASVAAPLGRLVQQISIGPLLGLLADALLVPVPEGVAPPTVEAGWLGPLTPTLERLERAVRSGCSAAELAEALDQIGVPSEFERQRAVAAVAAIHAQGPAASLLERWREVVVVLGLTRNAKRTTLAKRVGELTLTFTTLRQQHPHVVPLVNALHRLIASDEQADAASERGDRLADELAQLEQLYRDAQIVLQAWGPALRGQLRAEGLWSFDQVLAMAHELLGDEDLGPKLGEALGVKHIFVDEAQDTNEAQLALIDRLAQRCHAKRLWVGDEKQSIYRFRGAEVDVFRRLVRPDGGNRLQLTVNRRSDPQLIDSCNRLFAALLPARSGVEGLAQDPGAELAYDALTWPEEAGESDGAPRITLIAHPDPKSWGLPELDGGTSPDGDGASAADAASEGNDDAATNSAGDADDAAGEGDTEGGADAAARMAFKLAPHERAVVDWVSAQLADDELSRLTAAHRGHTVAVLTHSWDRVARYVSALARAGIAADVLGSRGLLDRPEVTHLLHWLRAFAERDDVGLLAALRGPGVALSDAGLYCVSHGFGVQREPATSAAPDHAAPAPSGSGPQLRRHATFGRALDPQAAAAAWLAHAGAPAHDATPTPDPAPAHDPALLREVLERDAAAFAKFVSLREGITHALRRGRMADGLEQLVRDAHLLAWWRTQPAGEVCVANVRRLIALVRDTEAQHGSAVATLRAMRDLADDDSQAAGLTDPTGKVQVAVTTIWQAKGLEWPAVAVPDLHLLGTRPPAATLSLTRVAPAEGAPGAAPQAGDARAVWLPGLPRTDDRVDPLKAQRSKVESAVHAAQYAPLARAELRRVLYVAMTRAKHRLCLAAQFKRSKKDDPDPCVDPAAPEPASSPKLLRLCTAITAAEGLAIALDLSFGADHQPRLSEERGHWRSGVDVVLQGPPAPMNGRTNEPDRTADTQRKPTRIAWSAAVAARVAPLPEVALEVLRPSQLKPVAPGQVPQPQVLGQWPAQPLARVRDREATAADEGTLLHAVLEEWGYLHTPLPTLEHVQRAFARQQPGDAALELPPARAQPTLDLVVRGLEAQPALVAELRAAAARRELLHELQIRIANARTHVSGSVDLLWRDDDGWHLLDYKWGIKVPHGPEPLHHEGLRTYFAQVRNYAEHLGPHLGLRTYGLWYGRAGLVLRWPTS